MKTAIKTHRGIFLAGVRGQTYKLMRNLVIPVLPSDKTYDELVQRMQEHYKPKLSVIV